MCKNLLDIKCDNEELFNLALIHPSFAQDKGLSAIESYERLEFFGDSVLKLCCSELLYHKFPEYEEGKLSQIRSILVSDVTIAKIALEIGLDKIIKLSKSEKKQGGSTRVSNLACAFEALLGAYYMDGKQKEVKEFLEYQLSKYIDEIDKNFVKFNAKAILQEYTQEKTKELPIYEVLSVSGPDHKPVFEVQVTYQGEVLAVEKGTTKKEAQQNCAYMACKVLKIIEE